jgi:hypothetical protein
LACALLLGAWAGAAGTASADPERTEYVSLTEFEATSDIFAAQSDDLFSVTRLYFEDYPHNCVLQVTIDPALGRVETPLPIPFGLPWLAEDLDGDGWIELVLQRGDSGMGGNGYLDILSAPDWVLRDRITLANMKVVFYPVAINADADADLEVYLTPSVLGGAARAMFVDYDRPADTFYVKANIATPAGTYGHTAAGDFDEDGRIEFITGNSAGYGLFEYDPEGAGGGLVYRQQVGDPYGGTHATALRPVPGGQLHALLGHSSFTHGYRYQLLRPTGDNTFAVARVFQETTGYAGHMPSFALDADSDGLDEFVMEFHPYARVYGWDPAGEEFTLAWTWDETSETGTLITWAATDLDRDGVREWCCTDHSYVVRAFEDQDAAADVAGGAGGAAWDLGLSVTPNPAPDGARIAWSPATSGDDPRRISLYDPQGRLVRRWLAPAAGWVSRQLDWDGRGARGETLPAGTYWLRAEGASATRTLRVVCMR